MFRPILLSGSGSDAHCDEARDASPASPRCQSSQSADALMMQVPSIEEPTELEASLVNQTSPSTSLKIPGLEQISEFLDTSEKSPGKLEAMDDEISALKLAADIVSSILCQLAGIFSNQTLDFFKYGPTPASFAYFLPGFELTTPVTGMTETKL